MRELAERAVKAKGWRWVPGMRCTHRWADGIRVLADESGEQSESYVVLPDADGNAVVTLHDGGIMGNFPDAGSDYPFLPDLRDPATLGCLRHLATAAHDAFDIRIQTGIAPRMEGASGRWRTVDSQGRLLRTGGFVVPLDGDAMVYGLVAALEAAP